MKKIIINCTLGVSLIAMLSSCGLSPEYRRNQLKNASNYDICYAITDPRRGMPMSGWTVKGRVAEEIARERGIICNQKDYSATHNQDAHTRAIGREQYQRNIKNLQNALDGNI